MEAEEALGYEEEITFVSFAPSTPSCFAFSCMTSTRA